MADFGTVITPPVAIPTPGTAMAMVDFSSIVRVVVVVAVVMVVTTLYRCQHSKRMCTSVHKDTFPTISPLSTR